MNFKRAARKTLSGLLSAMMVITQMSNNFTAFAEEIPVDEPAGEVASTPVETTEVPTPEPEAPPAEEVVPEQPAEVTPEPEADPVENPEPSETVTEEEEPEDLEKEEQEEKEEKEPNVRTVYEGYGEGVNLSVTLTDPEAIADDAVLNVEFIPTEDPTELIYDIYFTENKEEEGVVRTNLKSGSANVVMTFSASQLTDIIQATDNADLVLFDGNGAVLPSVTSIADQKISYTVTSVGKVRIFNQNYPKEETEEKSEEESAEDDQEADSRTVYTGSGDGIAVTAVLDDAAAIPDDAELSVYKVSESDTAIAYDISFVGPEKDEEGNATGNTITYEPTNGSVSLTVQFLEGQLSQQLGVESAEQVEVVHLPGSAMPEAVGANVSVEAETVSFALTSFSVIIFGKSWGSPDAAAKFAPPANQATYTDNGGTYKQGEVIQYLLSNYGVVTRNNAKLDTHTMAAILIGGNLTGKGSGFADDKETAKRVSSYVKGSVENFAGTSASRSGNTDLKPLYLGTSNHVEGHGGTPSSPSAPENWDLYYVWGKPRYNSTDSSNVGNPVYLTDDYIDFDKLYEVIRKESQQLLEQGSSGRPVREGNKLIIQAGQFVTIEDLAGIEEIDLIGDLTGTTNTLINLPQTGTINLPRVLINGAQPAVQEAGAGTAFVWNMPNATNVNVPTQNWVGHIIAPDAKIKQEGGNYNGGFICKEIESNAEGHTYQYNGGKLIPDKTGFSATKTFGTGVWPEGVTFTIDFTSSLGGDPLPANPTITLTKANPTAEFGYITFDPKNYAESPYAKQGPAVVDQLYTWEVGHLYNVKERTESAPGVTYDSRTEKLLLTVQYTYKLLPGGNEEKTAEIIKMEVSLDGGTTWSQLTTHSPYTFPFQNNSDAKAKAVLKATKVLDGRNWGDADSFDFVLTPIYEGAPMPEGNGNKATATKANQTAKFGEITFDTVGTYSYYIQEVEPENKLPGVTYDTTKYIANVVVKDVNGQMVAEVSYSTGPTLEVTNKYEDAKATLKATKEINDWGKADKFTFKLAAVSNTAGEGVETPMPASDTAEATSTNKTAVFGEITFYKEGTYNYTITEQDGNADGVSYDTTPHNVKVVVDRDADGKLQTTVTYDDDSDLTITNTYENVKTHFEATKKFNDWGKATSFTFDLAAGTNDAGVPTPMPSSTTETATEASPTAVFGDITFEKAGTYNYTITERNGGVDGVTYDTTPHNVVVTVTKADDATNKLTATVKYDDKNSLVITNTFKDVEATIEATKAFNDWGKAESFTFELTPAVAGTPMPAGTEGDKVSVTVTKDNKTAVFGKIAYDKAGEYVYNITEVKGNAPGVAYDTTAHKATVTVAKNAETNELTATVKYDSGSDSLTITNTYTSTEAELKATKEINDWGKAKEFTFNIVAVDGAPEPPVSSAKATEANPTAVFGTIEFEAPGTYEYTITEVNNHVDGVTYDTKAHKAVVTVTADKDTNALSATVKYDDKDALTITNKYASSKATIQATKAFNDWGKAQSFEFHLAPVTENAPMPARDSVMVTKEKPTGVFGEIEYSEAGEYEYKITETDDGVPGVTYDHTEHKVVVKVTKDPSTNVLTADVKYDDETSLIITNEFKATKAKIEATKEFNDWGKADSFTFLLATDDEEKNPLPSNRTAIATEEQKTVSFDEITFDAVGTYEYYIVEIDDHVPGVTYDTSRHAVTVEVTKNEKTNALEAEVIYADGESCIITNKFEATKAHFEATKEFNDWGKAESFTFELAALTEGAPMPKNTTATATSAKKTAVFDDIEFDTTGTYEYTITEQKGNVDGVTYDTQPHKVTVVVTADAQTNQLKAAVTYADDEPLIITNTFTATKAHFETTKAFNDWGKAKSFTFTLAAVGNDAGVTTPMPEKTTAIATEENKKAIFEDITFEKAGTYEYTITEKDDGADGVTYDTKPHTAYVIVTKDPDTNELSAEVKYEDDKTALVIANTYEDVKTHFEATKEFNDWGKAKSFTFNLAAVTEGAPMPSNTKAFATEEGKTAKFADISFEKTGVYEYTITEQNDGVDGVTYDTTPHKVVVTVTKEAGSNKLVADVKYDGEKQLIIKNTFTATEVPVKATKEFKDWGKADSFTFVLESIDDAPMPEGSADGKKTMKVTKDNPTAEFGNIKYERGGSYRYTITEVNDHVDGVTYDTKPHEVIVMINKDPGNNSLSGYAIYDGAEELIITNTYKSTEATIEATKEFEDWGKADSFTFKLAAVTPDAPMPASDTAVATEDAPLASFGTIKYEKAGEYKYTITEVNDGADGVTYDTTPHEVTVTVEKDPDTNELSASVTYDGAESLVITNTYAGTETTLEATKQFSEWGKAESFTFNIAPQNGAPAPEKLSAVATEKEKTASFGTVKFEKAGTYEYIITEVDDGVDGVTYDTAEHKAVVTVSKADDNTNKLTATVKYDDKDALVITNTYASEKAIIQATKTFKDWGKADSFTFNLAAVTKDAPMPAETSVTVTKAEPTGVFGEIEYEKAGTYEYTITEVNDHVDGVTYDTAEHKVVVDVKKGEGNKLTAKVTYDGQPNLVITNTYASTKATIEATKEFNDWGKAESFTFNLAAVTKDAPMPASATAKATKDAPKAIFGEIEFEKAGTYEYTITEVNDHVDGVTYDTTAHKVVVEVTADKDTNELSAVVTYDGAESLTITNTYTSVEEELHVTKAFEDWGKANSFTFNLAPLTEGAPMPEATEAVATENAKMAKFGPIKFEKAGTYQYTITERDDGVDGVTYDTKAHIATVEVTADPDTNELSSKVTYDAGANQLIITNTYASAKAQFEAEKKFDNWGKADSFTFNLEAVTEGAPMPASTSAIATEAKPTAVFEEIKYEKAGTYEYTITEVNDHVDGVTYDTTAHKVVVEVTKGEGNKLSAAVTYDGAESLVITNTYASTKATIEATKEFNDWGKAESFTFNLAAVTEGAPMPASTTATATEATPKAVFGEITFEKAGTYTYTITEVNDGVDGVTYDTTAHQVVVEVTADPDTNELSATVKYDGAESLTITNTYEGTEAPLEVTKQFNDWGAAKSFTFNIAPVGDAPAPENTRAQATEANKTASFGTVKLEKAGTYEYIITEVDDGVDGVTYDTSEHKAVITVAKEEGTNKLSATVKYDDKDALVITNTYASEKATIQATKAFEDWGKADSFTFNLAAVTKDAPMPAETSVTVTKAEPTGVFGEVEYKKAGTYEYTITEVNDHVDGVTYDTAEHKVVVEVKKTEGNKLVATVTYDGADSLVITNTYASTKAPIEVTKEFNDWGKANSFTFNLAAVDGAPMPASTTATATKDAPKASFGEITFEKSGTYKYTITEVNDHVPGVTYDTAAHEVVVEVTADPDTNELSAAVKYDGADSLVVTNTFTATTAHVEATKEINYWGKKGEFTFTFELAALSEGAPMPETTSQTVKKDSPTAVFGDMTFDKVGTYQYSITEKDEGLKGVTYDTAPHTATVEVIADPETNALSAKVTYADGEKAVITNKYEAKGEYTFGGIKTLEGRELEDAEFSFTLTGDKEVNQTVTNKGESFTFEPITFTHEDLEQNEDGTYKDGTFKYTIKEVVGDAKGVTYDETTYEITLTVSDNGDGTLKVEADKEMEEIEFINVYHQEKGEGEFIAKKVLRGNQKLKDQQFTFELKDKDGKVLQSKKNDANGNVQFDKIDYEEKGEFVYTVSEVNDGQKDVIYDNSVYTITVKVEDGENGKLKVTSVITKGGQVVEGIVFYNSTTPNTGVHNGTAFLTGAAAASLSGIAILEYLRRRQKNSKK